MALSNWATFALKTGSTESDEYDMLSGHGPASVEFYKNWLYVHHDGAEGQNDGYKDDTAGEIRSGALRVGRVNVCAERGPQNGVYAVIESGFKHHAQASREAVAEQHNKPVDEVNYQPWRAMIGCSVYGYEGEEWVGVTEESLRHLAACVGRDGERATGSWSSVTATLDDFAVSDITADEVGEQVKNQGNVFFEDELGIEIDTDEPVL